SVEAIVALFEKYPNGVGAKYRKRLRKEVERSYKKAVSNVVLVTTVPAGASPGSASPRAASQAGPSAGPSAGPAAAPAATASSHHLPTIRLIDGQLRRAVAAAEHAMISAGLEIYTHAGSLVYPTFENRMAAGGRKTITARLSAFSADSFVEPVAEAAIYQRWSVRKDAWADGGPPERLVRMALTR